MAVSEYHDIKSLPLLVRNSFADLEDMSKQLDAIMSACYNEGKAPTPEKQTLHKQISNWYFAYYFQGEKVTLEQVGAMYELIKTGRDMGLIPSKPTPGDMHDAFLKL